MASIVLTPLKAIRLRSGLRACKVAEIIGIDQSAYSKIERGLSTTSAATAEKLVDLFGRHQIDELQILYPHRYAVASAA